MVQSFVNIKKARVHNLKNLSVKIPKNKLVVITGVSGSGKSSLAFDTIYAEGQRRYVESLSAYARQFLGVMSKPDVDKIDGLSPAIAIDQRSASHNPRSTVATTTEIYDYLRLLFARVGVPHCPQCGQVLSSQTVSQITDQIMELLVETHCHASLQNEILIMGPVIRGKKGHHQSVLEEVKEAGFVSVRIDNQVYRLDKAVELKLNRYQQHNIEVIIDRLLIGDKTIDRARAADSIETALKIGQGLVVIGFADTRRRLVPTDDLIFSEQLSCQKCQINLPKIEPRTFSFNSPYGACPDCHGLGTKLEVDPDLVIPNKNLTLAEGAIKPWMTASHRVGRQGWYWWQISRLAEKYNFSMDAPVRSLKKQVIDLILYGSSPSSDRKQRTYWSDTRKGVIGQNDVFEGVIPNLERRWKETQSEATREEIEKYMRIKICPVCQGRRLRPEALAVRLAGQSIDQITGLSIVQAGDFFKGLLSARPQDSSPEPALSASEMAQNDVAPELSIAKPIIKEILNRLQFLIDVGLDYLTLDRSSASLAGGEAQRVKLATQIGSGLSGVIYILDEPSIGLHQRDIGRLIKTLKHLRDLGNTVIVVEHDEQTINAADWVLDIGPGAGQAGGRLVFEGIPSQLQRSKTLTGDYLAGRKSVVTDYSVGTRQIHSELFIASYLVPTGRQLYLTVKGAQEHNLKKIDVKIPLGKFVALTGVSGSGKSSLMNDILARALASEFHGAQQEPGKHQAITGTKHLNKVINIDQSPIGRTPRSNPATYSGAFSYIRDLFARSPEAQIRGYKAGRFSFNVKGGRCETCRGEGLRKIEMYFLPDVYVECQECNGSRYNRETLQIEYNGKNIAQVLDMDAKIAKSFFKNIPGLFRKLKTLCDVGLDYIKLGQPATTLSGGEAQRIKLAKELSRVATGKTLYLLDEPTTGLHFDDVRRLLQVLKRLVSQGNTVLIIEHNLDVISSADWIIDLGPEGGDDGGQIVVEGAPEKVVKSKKSWTGKYLKDKLL